MPIRRLISSPIAAVLAVLMWGQAARADLLVVIDKSAQRMTITVDGHELYKWPVATGAIDYDTPNGSFKPFRMEIDHHSDEWDNAPMPYSIFFTMTGNAIHGTYEVRSLGHAESHGCVRLLPANAAILWALVKQQKMANTTIVVTGDLPGAPPSNVALAPPKPLNPIDQLQRVLIPVPGWDFFSFFH